MYHRRMRTLVIGAVLLALTSGCSKKKAPSVDEMKKLRDEACACTDFACADKVDKKIASALEGLEAEDLNEEQTAVMTEAAMCVVRHGVD